VTDLWISREDLVRLNAPLEIKPQPFWMDVPCPHCDEYQRVTVEPLMKYQAVEDAAAAACKSDREKVREFPNG
jgi:hypothetical protein